MWGFIGFIILIAIIFGITPHEAFWSVVGITFAVIAVAAIVGLVWYLFTKPNKNGTIDSNKKEVAMKYGGVDAVPMGEISEAEVVKKPVRTYKPWEIALGLFVGAIKLIPITLLLMAIMWGLAFLITGKA